MKSVRAVFSVVLAFCLLVLGGFVAVSASAHTPTVKADCDQLTVSLASYNGSGTNTVKVTIDGGVRANTTFATSFQQTFPAPDKYQSYTYEVAVKAHDDPNGYKGWTTTFAGHSTACTPPPVKKGSLTISKHAVGGAGTFTFQVDCDGTAYDHLGAHAIKLTVADGATETEVLSGIPTNTVCTVTEDGDPLFTTTVDPAGGKVTIEADKTKTVTFTNTRKTGKLQITKIADATGLFKFHVSCTDGTKRDVQIEIGSGDLGKGKSAELISGIPTNTVCTVTEDGDPLFTTTVDPAGGQVTIEADKTKTVTFTNTRNTGKLQITKIADATGLFKFHVSCTDGTKRDVQIEIGSGDLGKGKSAELISGIPTNTVCTVTEDGDPLFTTTVDPAGGKVTIEADKTKTVTFTNTRNTGKLQITKIANATGVFTFDVSCTDGPSPQNIPITIDAGHLNVGVSTLVQGIPTGSVCTVTEDGNALFTTTVTPQDGKVTIGADTQTVTFTNTRRVPVPTLDKFANPATTDASPTLVQPGSRIDYSVKVGNTGNGPITGAPVVDTLPNSVSVVAGSVSDGGTVSQDGKSISWNVTLAPAESKTLTYSVTVDKAAPQGALLVNSVTFQNLTDTTTHVVPTGGLTLVKGVTPVAGNGVVVNVGDTLTYTLTASATGTLDQRNVVVSDYLPGFDPARPGSGKTTFVQGSASCIGGGTCSVTGPDGNGRITWSLGSMAAGTSRQVTFQVTIDDLTGAAGTTVAVDIVNAGSVKSDVSPATSSNEVSTPVTKVLAVKESQPPAQAPAALPHTGSSLPLSATVGGAIALLGLGLLMVVGSRRRTWTAGR